MIICPLHWYTDEDRLAAVTEEMRTRGAPTLRGHVDEVTGAVLLKEGTHRIHAAAKLGLTPRIVPVPWWRSRHGLVGARYAIRRRGLHFDRVEVVVPRARSWLAPEQIVLGIAYAGFAALVLLILAALAVGCSFPEEGIPVDTCPDCYRPPRDPGHHIDMPPASTSAGRETDAGGDGSGSSESTGDGVGTEDSTTGAESSSSGDASSSTGDEPYEPAHCDTSCPEGDAIQPSPEQSEGNFGGCYCATPCESDVDCAPHEWCDPFFGRCTVPCQNQDDCAQVDGELACDLWWNDAEHFTHFCSYPNEDAP